MTGVKKPVNIYTGAVTVEHEQHEPKVTCWVHAKDEALANEYAMQVVEDGELIDRRTIATVELQQVESPTVFWNPDWSSGKS